MSECSSGPSTLELCVLGQVTKPLEDLVPHEKKEDGSPCPAFLLRLLCGLNESTSVQVF